MTYFLSIAAIVRNEEDYLPEWIEFHLLQGVEHFYIFEHDPKSTDLEDVLAPYIETKVVTYDTWKGKKPQLPCYDYILGTYGRDNEWIAFIDADEFLYPSISSVRSIPALLHELPEYCSIYAVHWVLYGSNGHLYPNGDLVTDRFVRRAASPDKHVKSIVKPSLVIGPSGNPHAFVKKPKTRVLRGSDFATPLPDRYAILPSPVMEPLRINHYHTKSEYEYRKRRMYPRADNGEIFTIERVDEMFRAHDINEVPDLSATQWSKEIRDSLIRKGLFNGKRY